MIQNQLTVYDTDVYKIIKFCSDNRNFANIVFCGDLKCNTGFAENGRGLVHLVFSSNYDIDEWLNKIVEVPGNENMSYRLYAVEESVEPNKSFRSHSIAHGDFENGYYNMGNVKDPRDIKVFISQPMSGLSDVHIINNREAIIRAINSIKHKSNIINKLYGMPHGSIIYDIKFITDYINKSNDQFKVIDNLRFFKEDEKPKSLDIISRDIKDMSEADILVVAGGWDTRKGCKAEVAMAILYGLPIYFLDTPELEVDLRFIYKKQKNQKAFSSIILPEEDE